MNMTIEELDMSCRAYNGCKNHGCDKLVDLCRVRRSEMKRWYNVGAKTMREIEVALDQVGAPHLLRRVTR